MQNSVRHVPKKRAPRKLSGERAAVEYRQHIAGITNETAGYTRELKALRKHAAFLAARVVHLELALNRDARYSKQFVRKVLALAGDARLV